MFMPRYLLYRVLCFLCLAVIIILTSLIYFILSCCHFFCLVEDSPIKDLDEYLVLLLVLLGYVVSATKKELATKIHLTIIDLYSVFLLYDHQCLYRG